MYTYTYNMTAYIIIHKNSGKYWEDENQFTVYLRYREAKTVEKLINKAITTKEKVKIQKIYINKC